MLACGGDLHRLHDLSGELTVALRGEANTKRPRSHWAEAIAVDAGAGALQQSTVDQGPQQTEHGGLGQARCVPSLRES